MGKCEIIELTTKLFFRTPIKERRFYNEARIKIRRKEAREHLEQFHLACELAKLIRHCFPELLPLLKQVPDPRHQSYITYPGVILLMTRILSSLFYISSMRKASEEFNSEIMIKNIWLLCKEEPTVEELPYWETINRYLERLEPENLQEVIHCLCRRLLRSRAFEDMRIRGKYWQVIIDGTQLYSTQRELDGKSLHRTHNRGTEKEYQENYYYVLEAKLVLHPKILISIQTEFVDNEAGKEMTKQDCERKACWRLMEKVKKAFPRLPVCLCGDSLYACEGFFERCRKKNWRYIVRIIPRNRIIIMRSLNADIICRNLKNSFHFVRPPYAVPIKITSLLPNLYRKLDFPRHMNTSLCLQFYILHHKNSPFLSLPDDPVTTHSPCLSCQPFSHCRKKTPASLPQTEPPCFCGNQTPPPEYP